MLKRITPILVLVGVCWIVLVLNGLIFGGHLSSYGIVPRRLASIPAIFWAPLLHTSLNHLAANTIPLFVLGAVICSRSRSEFTAVALGGTVIGGALTWVFGRTASHIGASGLIFCFFGYLSSMAILKKTPGTLAVSVLCILGYGGIARGILPTSTSVSWEGHLAGLITGIFLAWFCSKMSSTATTLPPQRSVPASETASAWHPRDPLGE